MKGFFYVVKFLSYIMNCIAAAALASIVFLTVSDVILRRFRMPIDFTYEVVILLGAIAIGFSLPLTTLDKNHVQMDFVTEKLSRRWRKIFGVVTRFLGIGLFAVFGWKLIYLGKGLSKSGEVSPILQMPTYPVAYGLGACCFILCLVLLFNLLEQVMEDKA